MLHDLTESSCARTANLSVTGALLFTGSHFSQVIEGAAEDIDTLMTSIRADPRHDNLIVIEDVFPRGRRFSDWMNVYTGRAVYVQRIVDACLKFPDAPRSRAKLLRLFEEFSGG